MAETQGKVTIGSTTTAIVTAPTAPFKKVILVNDSDEAVYIKIGKAAVMNEGIRLNATGGSLELNESDKIKEAINGICSSGSKNITIYIDY